jgi:hypothetical protein
MPERISELARAVSDTPGFEDWAADFTPASLDRLGGWFAGQVEVRRRTSPEIRDIAERASFPIEIRDEELTNRTFSLAMDTGMYFSQVLLKNHPVLRWDQQLRGKRNADYGQPVLVEFGPAPLNPVRLLVTLAYGVAAKTKSEKRLRDLYDTWVELIRA